MLALFARIPSSAAASRENLTRNLRKTCPLFQPTAKKAPRKPPSPKMHPLFHGPNEKTEVDGEFSGQPKNPGRWIGTLFALPLPSQPPSPSPSSPAPSRLKTAAPRTTTLMRSPIAAVDGLRDGTACLDRNQDVSQTPKTTHDFSFPVLYLDFLRSKGRSSLFRELNS